MIEALESTGDKYMVIKKKKKIFFSIWNKMIYRESKIKYKYKYKKIFTDRKSSWNGIEELSRRD